MAVEAQCKMTKNLEHLAELAALDYLKNKKPLNDTIAKLAEDNSLNKHQIDRVVEKANQITYLSLFKSNNNDKYAAVNFDIADPIKINKELNKDKEKIAKLYLDDYMIQKEDMEFQKLAAETPSSINIWKVHGSLTKKANFLKAKNGANRAKFKQELDKFASYARSQILLNKLNFKELNSVFPVDFVEKVAGIYNIPNHEKIAMDDSEFILNENHPLVISYNELSRLEDEYIEIIKEAKELYKEAVEVADDMSSVKGGKALISGIAADIAKAWNVIKEVPAKHLVGYPAAFLLGIMYQKSKEQEATLTGNDVPLIFRAY